MELPADVAAWWQRANGIASRRSHQLFYLVPFYSPCRIEHALAGPMRGCVRAFDRVNTDGNPRRVSVSLMLADVADALENRRG